jgi:hypothetical protein
VHWPRANTDRAPRAHGDTCLRLPCPAATVLKSDLTLPNEVRLSEDYFGGYSDYPPFSRGVLLHSQAKLDKSALRMVRKYARWIYVTEARYKSGDPTAANPWDRLSKHLEAVCEQLVEK